MIDTYTYDELNDYGKKRAVFLLILNKVKNDFTLNREIKEFVENIIGIEKYNDALNKLNELNLNKQIVTEKELEKWCYEWDGTPYVY